jgi:hypothetical protein
MPQAKCVSLSTTDIKRRLKVTASAAGQPSKHVHRTCIGLVSSHNRPMQQMAAAANGNGVRSQAPDGVSRPAAGQDAQAWQAADPGRDGGPGVVALICGGPPHETTHWAGLAMAKVAGITLHVVRRICGAPQRQPNLMPSFKRWRDPRLSEKLADIVGL